jgi:hypothetical protein
MNTAFFTAGIRISRSDRSLAIKETEELKWVLPMNIFSLGSDDQCEIENTKMQRI